MSLAGAVRAIEGRFEAAGIEDAYVDAEILVAHVLGISRSELAVSDDRELGAADRDALAALVERRAAREPLQYVIGEWGFRRLTLRVDRRALIPRPETEMLVERVLGRLSGCAAPAVLDVGTGSGAIALAVADEHPGARILAIDSSADAVALARENVALCGMSVAVELHDLNDGLPAGPWDVVVSNPPYVPVADRDSLAPEVRDWEPAAALFDTGATEAIARGAGLVLSAGGALLLEVGDQQAAEVASLLRELGYTDIQVTKDLGGRERVVEATR